MTNSAAEVTNLLTCLFDSSVHVAVYASFVMSLVWFIMVYVSTVS